VASLSISRKILLISLLHLAVLAVVLLLFARSQFRFGPESLLAGPSRDRLLAIATSFSADFEVRSEVEQESLFDAYRTRYKAAFYLIEPQGRRIAGPIVEVPGEVLSEIGRGHRPPPRRDPPAPERSPDGDAPGAGPRHDGPPQEAPLQPPPIGATADSVFLVITRNPTRYWAGIRIPVSRSREEPRRPSVLLLSSDSLFSTDLFFDWRLWLGVALSAALASVLCWLPFIRGLTRSIARMDQVTGEIARGRFDVQVADERHDELGHLGIQINQMASRLQNIVGGQKRFLGDIAHELCAPVARIQFALGILEQKVDADQQRHVATLHEEIQEMSGLVNELLSFSKATVNADAPLLPVVVAPLAQRAVAREAVNAGSVNLSVDPDLAVMANEPMLLRAISNILRNAIRYAGEGGPIEIQARRQNQIVLITVSDQGPGLPESELAKVFEPFYRPETARARDTGGAGLGLAIVRTCIEACHGTVACANRKPTGLEVTIHLAAAHFPAL
jgi:two-component system, OmpR family, sensor histidine kinase CpxA